MIFNWYEENKAYTKNKRMKTYYIVIDNYPAIKLSIVSRSGYSDICIHGWNKPGYTYRWNGRLNKYKILDDAEKILLGNDGRPNMPIFDRLFTKAQTSTQNLKLVRRDK